MIEKNFILIYNIYYLFVMYVTMLFSHSEEAKEQKKKVIRATIRNQQMEKKGRK